MKAKDRSEHGPLFGLLFIILFLTYVGVSMASGLFGTAWDDLMRFVSGRAFEIAQRDSSPLSMVRTSFALSIIMFPLILVTGLTIMRLIPPRKDERVVVIAPLAPGASAGARFGALVKGLHKIAAIVLFEEFYTRWLLLGVLAGAHPSANTFYGLFLIGNGLWAIGHLWNYPPGDRNIVRVLPQFLLGIPMAVMFRSCGLAGAFTAHFVWNMLPLLPRFVDQAYRGESLTLGSTG